MREESQETRKLVFILGFMASGKTTVARELARVLNCRVDDLDELISQREQRSPGEIIERSGEDEFRRIETEILGEVLAEESAGLTAHVIALGGGTWTLERNRDLINAAPGVTVWLDAPFALCWERIQASDGGRPLALDEPEARRLYAERQRQYSLAEVHLQIDANQRAAEICEALVEALRSGSR